MKKIPLKLNIKRSVIDWLLRSAVKAEIKRRKYIEQMEEKGFHFNRKKDGEIWAGRR